MPIAKKIFILSLFLFVFCLALWGIYSFSFQKKKPLETKIPESVVQTPIEEKKEAEAIIAITDEAVIAPVLSEKEGRIKYYSATNGKTFEMDFDGQNKTILSEKELIGLSGVSWSPDKTKVISKFVRPGIKTQFFLYDYTEKIGSPIKENVDEIVWQANSSKIFYKFYDSKTKERTLNVSDPDGKNWNKLIDLPFQKISLAQIPQSGLLSFWNYPDAFLETNLSIMPAIGGEAKLIFKEKFGADYLWESSGNLALISHTEEKGGHKIMLSVINYNGGEYKNLGIPTFVSKCAWSKTGQTIYYSLPSGIPPGSVLPNDYLSKKFTTTDTFWKINLQTGEKSRVIEPEKIPGKFDAQNIFLNSDESFLFFTNQIDGKLYRLAL